MVNGGFFLFPKLLLRHLERASLKSTRVNQKPKKK